MCDAKRRNHKMSVLAKPKPTAYIVKAGALEKMEKAHSKEERKQQAKEVAEFARIFEERNMKKK